MINDSSLKTMSHRSDNLIMHYIKNLFMAAAFFLPAVIANEATFMICEYINNAAPNKNVCGIFASYTNEKVRQTVKATSAGSVGCSYTLLKKHTNSAGFWVNADIIGSNAGANIGYNPTGKSINLNSRAAKSTTGTSANDAAYLKGRCANEFEDLFKAGAPQVTQSYERYYENLEDILN